MSTVSPSHNSQIERQEAGGEGPQTQNPKTNSDSDPLQNQPSLALEDPATLNHQEPVNTDKQQQNQRKQESQGVDDQEQEDPEGTTLSPPYYPPTAGDSPVASSRRAPKRKKGVCKVNYRKQAAIEKKLQVLTPNFKPIPFVPGKRLDFSRHEESLKRIGLWDFAHLEFDTNLRVDLIAQLIVSYNSQQRYGYVNDCRINVNRSVLGRALKLPVTGKKPVEFEADRLPEEFVSFIDEFVSNWMLLHDDTWMMPEKVLNWTRVIKEGHLEKVDWPGLIWFMVEKELAQGPQLVNCYYASHLQQLIKMQKEEVLREKPKIAMGVKENEDDIAVKMGGSDESLAAPAFDDQDIELSLGQNSAADGDNDEAVHKSEKNDEFDNTEDIEYADKVENLEDANAEIISNPENMLEAVDDGNVQREEVRSKDMIDFEDCEGKEQTQWLLDGKNDVGELILQRCSMAYVKLDDDQVRQVGQGEDLEEEDDETEDDEPVQGLDTIQKCNAFDALSSENLLQAMEEGMQMPFTSEICGQSSLNLLSRRDDNNVMMGGPSIFLVNTAKREIDHDTDISDPAVNDNHKRPRIDVPWDQKTPDFHVCMEHIQHWAGKARMAYEAIREEACQQANMTQQFLLNELDNKEDMIQQLKSNIEELHKGRQAEINRFDNELCVMSRLLDGYRRALKDTQEAFAEYRERCPCPLLDKPIYRDAGDGGIVKSIMELEKEQAKREEEERIMRTVIEGLMRKFETEWNSKFEDHLAEVRLLGSRLMNLRANVELLKNLFSKHKASDHVSDE